MTRPTTKKPQAEGEKPEQTAITPVQSRWREMTAEQLRTLLIPKLNSKNPNQKDVALMRDVLEAMPEISRQIGDIAGLVRNRIIEDMSPNTVVVEEIRSAVERIHESLGYKEAPAIERLLIQQIGVCWVHLYWTHNHYVSAITAGNMTINQADFRERRLTLAQIRFLRAVEMLARVRKLARGSAGHTVMLNVAHQQINAAIGGSNP